MKNLFSTPLVVIYAFLSTFSLTILISIMLGLALIGGKSVPIPDKPGTMLVTEDSKPLSTTFVYINEFYLKDVGIFLDQNSYLFFIWVFLLTPGTFLLAFLGLLSKLEKAKKKNSKIALRFALLSLFSPFILFGFVYLIGVLGYYAS